MPRPRNAKEAICEIKIAVELFGFSFTLNFLKVNEDFLRKFADENVEDSKEQLKTLTEDVGSTENDYQDN